MLGSLLFVRPSEGEFAVPDVNTEVVILFWADMTLAEVSCAAVTRELGVANELNVRIPFVAFSVEADIVAFGLLGSLLGRVATFTVPSVVRLVRGIDIVMCLPIGAAVVTVSVVGPVPWVVPLDVSSDVWLPTLVSVVVVILVGLVPRVTARDTFVCTEP